MESVACEGFASDAEYEEEVAPIVFSVVTLDEDAFALQSGWHHFAERAGRVPDAQVLHNLAETTMSPCPVIPKGPDP